MKYLPKISLLLIVLMGSCGGHVNSTKDKQLSDNLTTMSADTANSTSIIDTVHLPHLIKSQIILQFDINKYKSLFKYINLKKFKMDTIPWEERKNYYKKLDEKAFYEIWQDTTKEYLDWDEEIDKSFFYSIQNNKRGFTEITILSQQEGAYCDWIHYLIFNNYGKLIDAFEVAGGCGDGGYYNTDFGHFINDSTYVLLSESNDETKNVDSTQIITYSQATTTITKSGKTFRGYRVLKRENKP